MGTADGRVKLRDALASLGLDALVWPPPVPSPGQAWPQWVMSEVSGYCAYTHTWECYVALTGSNPQSTAEAADALIEPLSDVLGAVAVVVQLEPALLTLTDNQNGLPVIRARVQTT